MRAVNYLIAAYVATWLIHGVYIGSLVIRFSQIRRQMRELDKEK